jgi:DNA-binding MarR family transcriptional regulator
MRHRMAGEELDMGAVRLLKALHGRPMRLTELAAVVDLDASTVSRQVRNLEAGGLVERTEDPTDRRATVLALAEKGRTRLRAGAARRRRAIAALVADWPDHDREQLRRLLARLLQELDRQESP